MQPDHNEFGQPIGRSLANWRAPDYPQSRVLSGDYCRLEPLHARHAQDLYEANSLDVDGRGWTYLPYGPFASLADYMAWLQRQMAPVQKDTSQLHAIVDLASGRATGMAGYLRPDPGNGVIEIGHLNFSPLLQQTRAATEALYLLIANVFALGYRRCEWKCNALNEASRRAALRLGFTFEGIFRQLVVVKGRNRDTAWFSIIDEEWPVAEKALQAWLVPENFDAEGRQRKSLWAFRSA